MYQTNDLALTAAMVTLGYKIAEIRGTNNKTTFIFDDNENFMQDMSIKFMNDELLVPSKSFFNNIKTIKNIVRG